MDQDELPSSISKLGSGNRKYCVLMDRTFLVSKVTSYRAQAPVIITGTSHGGTSLMAAAVRQLGIDMGRDLAHNYEDQSVYDCYYPSPDFNRLSKLGESRAEKRVRWGFKLPLVSSYLPQTADCFQNPTFIFVFRNPFSCAAGGSFTGEDFYTSLFWTSDFYRKIAEFSQVNRGKYNMAFCSYEQLAADPIPTMKEIAKLIEIDFSEIHEQRVNRVNSGESGGYLAASDSEGHEDPSELL